MGHHNLGQFVQLLTIPQFCGKWHQINGSWNTEHVRSTTVSIQIDCSTIPLAVTYRKWQPKMATLYFRNIVESLFNLSSLVIFHLHSGCILYIAPHVYSPCFIPSPYTNAQKGAVGNCINKIKIPFYQAVMHGDLCASCYACSEFQAKAAPNEQHNECCVTWCKQLSKKCSWHIRLKKKCFSCCAIWFISVSFHTRCA